MRLLEYITKKKLQNTRWGGDMSLTKILLQPIHRLLRAGLSKVAGCRRKSLPTCTDDVFLHKISLDWLLTLTTQPSTSKLSGNPVREYVQLHPIASLFWSNKIYRKSLFLSKISWEKGVDCMFCYRVLIMASFILQTQHRSPVLVHTAPRRWNSTNQLHPNSHLESDIANLSHLLSLMLQINFISC